MSGRKIWTFLPKIRVRPELLLLAFLANGAAPFLEWWVLVISLATRKIQISIAVIRWVKRQLTSVLDKLLAERQFICGDEYTIADMAIWAWYGQLVLGRLYNAGEFLDVVKTYTQVVDEHKK